jgi:hypothetical protein
VLWSSETLTASTSASSGRCSPRTWVTTLNISHVATFPG